MTHTYVFSFQYVTFSLSKSPTMFQFIYYESIMISLLLCFFPVVHYDYSCIEIKTVAYDNSAIIILSSTMIMQRSTLFTMFS